MTSLEQDPDEVALFKERTLKELKRRAIAARERAEAALPALERLCEVMKHGTGQGYKLREFLFGLWNGKPVEILQIVSLDQELRDDLLKFMSGYGFEDHHVACFYHAIQEAVSKCGLWEWFLEEQFNVSKLREYVRQTERSL
jgi:hypothetical protein